MMPAIKGKPKKVKYVNEKGDVLWHYKGEQIPEGFERSQRYTEEAKKRMSESAKARGAPESAFRDKSGKNNPTYGRKMYHDPITREHKYFVEGEQPIGWLLGYGVDYRPRVV